MLQVQLCAGNAQPQDDDTSPSANILLFLRPSTILAASYGRKCSHVENGKRHLPEEKRILGQLRLLPSVLFHNPQDDERKSEEKQEKGGFGCIQYQNRY